MPTFAFPSGTAPALPAVVLDAPDGWVPTTYPGVLLAAFEPRPEGQFRPNLIVSVTRHEPGYTLDEAVATLIETLEALPEASLRDVSDPTEISAAKAVAFLDPEAGTLVQVHVVVIADQGACVDLVQLTVSCSGATLAEDEAAMDKIVSSLSVSSLMEVQS